MECSQYQQDGELAFLTYWQVVITEAYTILTQVSKKVMIDIQSIVISVDEYSNIMDTTKWGKKRCSKKIGVIRSIIWKSCCILYKSI